MEDDLFGQGGVTATQALRVVEAQPSSRGQLALPGEEDLGLDVLLADAAPAPQVGELPHQVFLQPCANLVGERLQFGGPGELHGYRRYRSPAPVWCPVVRSPASGRSRVTLS